LYCAQCNYIFFYQINFEVVKVEPQQDDDSPTDDHLTGPDTENNFTSVVFPVVKTEVQVSQMAVSFTVFFIQYAWNFDLV
jgi:hypothetical protein